MRHDVETTPFIMDEVGDQISGCESSLEDLAGVKAPVTRQGQGSGVMVQVILSFLFLTKCRCDHLFPLQPKW